ncbi:MAG: hypothetical protein F4121_05725, partial [Acidimicrobiia bacterium]|nr:hypothetical protein [Acidimicrobiia bacterium]
AAGREGLRFLHVAVHGLLLDPRGWGAHGISAAVRDAGGILSVDACSVGAIADSGVDAFRDTLVGIGPDLLLCDAGEADLLEATGGHRQLADLVVIKDGPRPTRLYGAGFDGEALTPPPLERVPDTTGAGDSFAGGLLAARLAGSDWLEATATGQAAAALHLRALAAAATESPGSTGEAGTAT